MTVRLLALPPPLPFADRKKRSFSRRTNIPSARHMGFDAFPHHIESLSQYYFTQKFYSEEWIYKTAYFFFSKTTSVTFGMFFLGGIDSMPRKGLIVRARPGQGGERIRFQEKQPIAEVFQKYLPFPPPLPWD